MPFTGIPGAGIRLSCNYGEADDIGYCVTKDKMTPQDRQGMVLQQLGLASYKLRYRHQGLNQWLIGPTDEGRVMKDLLI